MTKVVSGSFQRKGRRKGQVLFKVLELFFGVINRQELTALVQVAISRLSTGLAFEMMLDGFTVSTSGSVKAIFLITLMSKP
jgi:hypothetical protein